MSGLGTVMLVSAGAILVLMLASWALATAISDVSIVDVVWGLGFVVVAWVAFVAGDGDDARRALAVVLVTLWGGRLAGYIARRKLREQREDPRYAAMRERSEHFVALSLVKIFSFQGLLVFVVSLGLQGNGSSGDGLGAIDVVGVALWAVGIFFEAVGDGQLARFKADPANKGKVMDLGLWRYTRHPNYFGDFCVWWGLGLIGLGAGAWWGLVGPVIMTVLLTRVSGKDLLEKSMSKREGYAEYVERTSGFVPLPPRSAAARKT